MSSVTQNMRLLGMGEWPSDGNLFPPKRNRRFTIEKLQGTVDTSDKLFWGGLCYNKGTSIVNDMEVITADWGEAETEGSLYIVVPEKGDIRFPWTTGNANFPGLIPRNGSVTLTDYQFTAGQHCLVVELIPGVEHWATLGVAGSHDCVEGQLYFTTAAGHLVVGDAPSGESPDEQRHGWLCLRTTTNINWGFFRYLGLVGADAA